MSSKFAFATLLAPICYIAMLVVVFFAMMENSPDYLDYLAIGLIAAIPVSALVSFLAIVLNRAPAVYSIAQGTLVVLGFPAAVGSLGLPPFNQGSMMTLMWKLLLAVAFISPVIGSIAGTRTEMGRRAINRQFPTESQHVPGAPPR